MPATRLIMPFSSYFEILYFLSKNLENGYIYVFHGATGLGRYGLPRKTFPQRKFLDLPTKPLYSGDSKAKKSLPGRNLKSSLHQGQPKPGGIGAFGRRTTLSFHRMAFHHWMIWFALVTPRPSSEEPSPLFARAGGFQPPQKLRRRNAQRPRR